MSDSQQKSKQSQTPGRITAFLDRLSTSNLVFVVGAIFAIDLFVPDMLPFVDEVVLGVLTLLLARWRAGAQERAARTGSNGEGDGYEKPPPKNVTPSS